ncbi:mitochondrial distribution and morphology protein 34 [Aaosphaeria arxii CBS 175.79]|uniref:Mitochondrial distribution and morphology protein 34 n=1 Tax=Aaosphaeria arxii CBS 175.79 TaxID=1450172 RepID=A0A6A5XNY2_9PLEO|nr:mitochondrial distribution and morphology protein 34 [Aaosphaeria arxii CBS 175.79]KAF2014616.1 mitochondrial distribution and morphology protein 34 [Aaosphaeria arxii CBS 175.79]
MAFNFNWSPLIADTSRARDMLTTALNKSPKPPIIVDDIIVTELNLGTTPPELEILEIGDLAEDRFRGIFKMSYAGDAFLTLKTKVQANPLNTLLSTRPSFASPEPLAAAEGLTIPLAITLSDIRLSGFVILVFSKQKGLTLVFRNDPLESLKVSSTFDSIPFVRDYLQKEIEKQLRVLFMDDLPAIIHRLSHRLLDPEYQQVDDAEKRLDDANDKSARIDPLATPPQDAVDAFGNLLDLSHISDLSLEPSEIHASFSQKNILRLAALSESQRTLSLFTPGIREAVFRAWASHSDQNSPGSSTPALTQSSLSRIQSTFGSLKSHSSSVASDSTGNETLSSRPTMTSYSSAPAGLSLGANRSRTSNMRKRKKRVVNLRKDKDGAESSEVSTEANTPLHSTNVSETASDFPESVPEERELEEELATPPKTPERRTLNRRSSFELAEAAPISEKSPVEPLLPAAPILADAPKFTKPKQKSKAEEAAHERKRSYSSRTPLRSSHLRPPQQATSPLLRSLSFDKVSTLSSVLPPMSPPQMESSASSSSGGILEQAWMLKMAQEIARKVQEEKDREADREREFNRATQPQTTSKAAEGMWASSHEELDAPPSYQASI